MMKKRHKRTKEKAKRLRRRSTWKHYLLLFLLLVLLYLSLGRYFADQAEEAFRQYLYTHSKTPGEKLLRIELLNYDRTLLGARARLRLSSDIPVVAERIGEINIMAKLINGPVFLSRQGVSTGSSRWLFSIDKKNSTEAELANLRVIFPQQFPRIVVQTDFRHRANYFARLDTQLAQLRLSGFYQFETAEQTESNHGSIQIDKLHWGVPPKTLLAESIAISFQQNGAAVSAGYKPGLIAVRSPLVLIGHPLFKDKLSISLVAKSDLGIDAGLLNGFVQLNVKQSQQKNKELPFETARASLHFAGLSAEAIVALSESKAELDNLKQQVNWILEDMGEYPEGRDALFALNDKIKSAQMTLNQLLLNKILHGKDSKFRLEISTRQGENNSFIRLNLAGKKNKEKNAYQSESALAPLLTTMDGEMTGRLSNQWQQYLTRLVNKLGKSDVLSLKKEFKVDLQSMISWLEGNFEHGFLR